MPGLIVFAQHENGNDRSAWELGATQTAAATSIAQPSRGLATFLFFGFIGGFILNLMPCVLPVISLKIFGFIKHADKDRRGVFTGARARNAACRRLRTRNGSAHHAAYRRGIHPRRDSVSFAEAEETVAVAL